MKKFLSSLQSASAILHSYISAVMLLFFAEVYIRGSYFPQHAVETHAFLIIISGHALKFVLGSGLYGALVELCSGEKYCVSVKDFWRNVRDFLLFYLFIHFGKFFLLFLFYAVNPDWNLNLLGGGLDGLLLVWLSLYMIRKKYKADTRVKWRPGRFCLERTVPPVVLYVIYIGILSCQSFVRMKAYVLSDVLVLLSQYVLLLIFVLSTKFILSGYPTVGRRYHSSKELILINPFGGGSFFESMASFALRFYPPVFTVLKALTPPEYRVRTFSRVFWRRRYYKADVLVAITCYTSNSFEAYKIAKEYKRHGAKVVMGGPHVASLPHEASEFCDSVVLGEAEGVWGEVIHDYENDRLKPIYHGVGTEEQYQKVHRYLLQAPLPEVKDYLETNRGCKFHCYFCAVYNIYEGRTYQKPVSEVIELVQRLRPRYKYFHFLDSNIYTNPAYVKELFEALIPLKIVWTGHCSIDIAANPEILSLAKKSGCIGILVGYEIRHSSPEKNQGGKLGMAEKYLEYTRIVKKAGINVKGHYIFGFDSDKYAHLIANWLFCLSIFPSWTILSILTPMPGTQHFADMLKEDRIINANWKWYTTFRLLFQPRRMKYRLLKHVYPLIKTFFFLTTAQNGWLLTLSIFLFIKIILTLA